MIKGEHDRSVPDSSELHILGGESEKEIPPGLYETIIEGEKIGHGRVALNKLIANLRQIQSPYYQAIYSKAYQLREEGKQQLSGLLWKRQAYVGWTYVQSLPSKQGGDDQKSEAGFYYRSRVTYLPRQEFNPEKFVMQLTSCGRYGIHSEPVILALSLFDSEISSITISNENPFGFDWDYGSFRETLSVVGQEELISLLDSYYKSFQFFSSTGLYGIIGAGSGRFKLTINLGENPGVTTYQDNQGAPYHKKAALYSKLAYSPLSQHFQRSIEVKGDFKESEEFKTFDHPDLTILDFEKTVKLALGLIPTK